MGGHHLPGPEGPGLFCVRIRSAIKAKHVYWVKLDPGNVK